MKKGLGYFAIAFAAFALAACDSSTSNPADAGQAQVQTETGENQSDPGNDGNEDYSSSSFVLPESSETMSPESAESTEPTSTESSETPASESSGTTPESAGTTAPESSATSALTPLQEYEQAQDFIDDGWRDECLRLANEYRATEGVAPLELADEDVQWCTVQQAKADAEVDKAHANSRMCGIGAQNTGPHFSTTWKKNASSAVRSFIKMMWEDEKALVTSGERDPNKDEDYTYIGHYLNMRNAAYTKLACGIYVYDDGKKAWFNMNFYR
jgi:hypothetical protein